MGTPVLVEVVQRPLTSSIITILCAIYLYITSRRLGYSDVGLSYDRAVINHELWRIVTAQLSHIDLIHLIFNVSSLWSLGGLEVERGHLDYLQTSLVLLLCSGALALASYHILGVVLGREQYLHVTAVGYSCVIFGQMTMAAITGPSTTRLFGMGKVPSALTPFLSLVVTSLLIPRASFIGHLSGIAAGFLVAAHLFDWLTPWWTASMVIWTTLLFVWQAAQSGHINLPFLQFPAAADVETGGAALLLITPLERR